MNIYKKAGQVLVEIRGGAPLLVAHRYSVIDSITCKVYIYTGNVHIKYPGMRVWVGLGNFGAVFDLVLSLGFRTNERSRRINPYPLPGAANELPRVDGV